MLICVSHKQILWRACEASQTRACGITFRHAGNQTNTWRSRNIIPAGRNELAALLLIDYEATRLVDGELLGAKWHLNCNHNHCERKKA